MRLMKRGWMKKRARMRKQSYKESYETGSRCLKEANVGEAYLDARYLLEFVCHTDRNTLLLHGERELTEEETQQYEAGIAKRAQGIPLQYITNQQEFMGLSFFVNEKVLIPRQDTEILVEEAMLRIHDGMRILDLCTGSGCILLSLLHFKNDCIGIGTDISEEALTVARENGERMQSDAVFLQSDLFDAIREKFDVIVSNPPYIPTQEIETLMREVKEHEPYLALDGKDDGLYYYRKIIAQSKAYLLGGGSLLLEIGYDQGADVKALMEQHAFTQVTVIQDYAGLDRVVTGTFRRSEHV